MVCSHATHRPVREGARRPQVFAASPGCVEKNSVPVPRGAYIGDADSGFGGSCGMLALAPCFDLGAALTLPQRRGDGAPGSRAGNPAQCLRCRAALLAQALSEGWNMDALLYSYMPIVIFIAVAAAIGIALIAVPFLVAYKSPDPEKLSAYECGFNAFSDARMKFDVRFYLVSILFIIFDLEVAFLFPWAVSFGVIGWVGFWSMMLFLGVLTIGFIYEWKKGALEWD
jgi:NADH-quinone oxidoreductase subunit A